MVIPRLGNIKALSALGRHTIANSLVSSSQRLLALFVCEEPLWPAVIPVSSCIQILLFLHGRG